MAQKANKAKEMAIKLKGLYRASMISYHSHISQNCNKSGKMIKNKPIGQMPQYFKLDEAVEAELTKGCSHGHDHSHDHVKP